MCPYQYLNTLFLEIHSSLWQHIKSFLTCRCKHLSAAAAPLWILYLPVRFVSFDVILIKCLSRFALGDARRSLPETAALVEDIVHTQLINMVTDLKLKFGTAGSHLVSQLFQTGTTLL